LEKIEPKENNEVQHVVKVLKDFKTIKDMCFGKEVKSDYRVAIKEFEASYKLLGISVTPKVHAVLDHIEDFFVRQNDGLGVGHYSENRPKRPYTKTLPSFGLEQVTRGR